MDGTGKKRVLLVDDSSTALLMERMILDRGRYEVVTARNGAEAVEKALALRPDVIVMDVMMPEMTGIEACRTIRANREIRHTPVILVTTRGEPEHVEAGFASGCNEYVTKPVDAVELLSKMQSVLGTVL
ncbi:MAG TPA: response regulator [Myxococcota bacterium]|jgi:CheY-like chemotaxis protein